MLEKVIGTKLDALGSAYVRQSIDIDGKIADIIPWSRHHMYR